MTDFEDLLCLFSATITESNGSVTIEIPDHEVAAGTLEPETTYRFAVLPPVERANQRETTANSSPQSRTNNEAPPVKEGEVLDLEIEDLGEQGDGIARVGPGYVVIVNDADLGERVQAEITDVRDNLAFADVVNYYDRA